jgi:hypothetical protein
MAGEIETRSTMSAEQNKLLVRRLVEEAVGDGNLELVDELASGEFAQAARRWVQPFQTPSPTSRWRSWT